jgi:hypothetical protein
MLMAVLCFAVSLSGAPWAEAKGSESYDLIVVGSDPEGIAAAISGARNGLDTLLVDTRPTVGGLMTRGWLNTIDMNYKYNPYGPKFDYLNKGIFTEFFKQIEGDSFDVTTAQNVFNDMLEQEDDIDFVLNAKSITPVTTKQKDATVVTGVTVKQVNGETVTYEGKRVIDATQDADLAAAAGVPFSLAHEDYGYPGKNMAVTLVFRLEGLTDEDWRNVAVALNADDDPNTGANSVSAWGFGVEMEGFQSTNPRVGMRGLNIGRQNDNSILINALHVYNVNPLSAASKAEAIALAREELPNIVEYLNENIPGLENAFFAGAAPELYIRESRHIYGEYRLTIDDLLENRDFEDRIGFGSYPVDVQSTGEKQQEKGYVVGKPAQYAIPFRSIVPLEVENLLVVGRSASFDSLAHGSARVIPTGMATGQAAGAAAAISIDEEVNFREMSKDKELIKQLQQTLNRQGMEIEPFDLSSKAKEKNHWSYEGLKLVRKHGLATGGYTNNYNLDNPIFTGNFLHILDEMTTIYDVKVSADVEQDDYDQGQELEEDDLEDILDQYGYSLKVLRESTLKNNIDDNDGIITYGAGYMVIYHLFDDLKLL